MSDKSFALIQQVKITISFLIFSLLSGCAMSPSNGQGLQFNGINILSEQAAKSLPRLERLNTITESMKSVGFNHVRVSYLFDKYSSTVLDIYENQYELMNEHKTLLDNHKDVMSFLMANKGKNEQELQQEVNRFDATIEDPKLKIGAKLKAYQQASKNIWQENAKLTAKIAVQALELSLVLYKASKTEDGVEDLIVANFVQMLIAAKQLQKASNLAKTRLHLSKLANDFIKDEQAIIDISKQLQKYQDNH